MGRIYRHRGAVPLHRRGARQQPLPAAEVEEDVEGVRILADGGVDYVRDDGAVLEQRLEEPGEVILGGMAG